MRISQETIFQDEVFSGIGGAGKDCQVRFTKSSQDGEGTVLTVGRYLISVLEDPTLTVSILKGRRSVPGADDLGLGEDLVEVAIITAIILESPVSKGTLTLAIEGELVQEGEGVVLSVDDITISSVDLPV